jgi:AAA family ATP:ADP antiporter
MKNYFEFVKELPKDFKRNGFFIFLTYFFALFSYPFVRGSTGAIFYESYSSNEYSFATFIAIVALIFIIFISSKLQAKIGVHKLYLLLGSATIIALLGFHYLHAAGIKPMAYGLFATKEIYIVLLIHLCLAFSNSYFSMEQLKRLYGPLGAAGSIGGIIGGQMTAHMARDYGTNSVFYFSLILIFAALVSFYQTRHANIENKEISEEKEESPLKSVSGIGKYIVLIALIVALTQVVIYIADLQFNIVFEKVVQTKDLRTAYLGEIFSYTNMGTLFFQLIIIPYALVRVPIKYVFYFIPFLYLILIVGGLGLGAGSLYVVAGVFILLKACDYSLFSASKEVMYHPLTKLQKYGAKYITDIFVYRLAKAVVSFIMSFFLVKNATYLNTIQIVCLALWIVCIYYLFKEQKNKNFHLNN